MTLFESEKGAKVRPLGVTFLAILNFVAAIGSILAMLILVIGNPPWPWGDPTPLLIGTLIGALISAVSGIGLWKLRNWARVLTIILGALVLMGSLAVPISLIGLVVGALMIGYMFSGSVREAFGIEGSVPRKQTFALVALLSLIGGVMYLSSSEELEQERMGANEAAAINSIRNIVTSQITYSANLGKGNYAVNLKALGDAGLIRSVLASGTRFGYAFSTSGDADTFTVSATPLDYGSTGAHSFFSDESGVVRYTREDRPATVGDPPLGQ